MAIMTVTLKATLKKGVFYWVSEVNAVSEDWAFTDFEVVAK